MFHLLWEILLRRMWRRGMKHSFSLDFSLSAEDPNVAVVERTWPLAGWVLHFLWSLTALSQPHGRFWGDQLDRREGIWGGAISSPRPEKIKAEILNVFELAELTLRLHFQREESSRVGYLLVDWSKLFKFFYSIYVSSNIIELVVSWNWAQYSEIHGENEVWSAEELSW